MENRGITEIRISVEALRDERVTSTGKLLLGLISSGLVTTQVEMAKMLGVSDSCVRKNVRRLTAMGYLAERSYQLTLGPKF